MSIEYTGEITNVSANPADDPKHFCIEYTDDKETHRIFTIDIAHTLKGCFLLPAIGKPITVTTTPKDEVAIVDVQGQQIFPM